MLNWLKSLKISSSRKRPQKQADSRSRSTPKRSGRGKSKAKSNSASSAARHDSSDKAVILTRGEHGISRDNIDKHALKVLYRLHKSGYHACLVGGAVRDLLLGVEPKDFDVATDATPEEVNKLFRNCRLIGRRFRLAHVHFGRQIIEVATYRTNHDMTQSGQLDESGRIVRDNVYGELADDVWRRDFTVNALYYDISDFSVIDFVGGFEDIRKQRLHLIGDAETRYREDPVRMLRAIRFSAKLGFDIDAASREPIFELGYLLQDIPPARLYEEALKLFHSGHALRSFELLREFDLLKYLFPEAAKSIDADASVEQMLRIAMQNTDDRIRKDMRVTPAFLFAALLWHAVNSRVHELTDKGMPYSVAIQKIATRVLSQQSSSVSIPKRFTSTMRDIWGLQTRFHYRAGKRAQAVLAHEKFRAAYDFLCIRAQASALVNAQISQPDTDQLDTGQQADDTASDENGTQQNDLQQNCEWWTQIQKCSSDEQQAMLFKQSKSGSSRSGGRRRRSRRSSAKKKKAATTPST